MLDRLRLVSPFWVSVVILLLSIGVLREGGLSPAKRLVAVAGLMVSVLIVLVAGVKWLTCDQGIRDWESGGVASIVRDDSRKLVWSDWAVLVTRSGSIDLRTQRLRLETRVFLGLLPWKRVDRRLTALDDIQAVHHYYEGSEESPITHQRSEVAIYDHAVELHRADGQPIRLFDLVSTGWGDESAALVDRLAARAKAAIRRS